MATAVDVSPDVLQGVFIDVPAHDMRAIYKGACDSATATVVFDY